MNIIDVKLSELVPYANNPRVNERAVEVVAQSIKEFGFKNPIIVDKDMVIIAGHTRYRASKRLGLEEVPVLVANDLSPEQAQAFRIMDNKSSEFAEWDYEKLIEEINELNSAGYDGELTGFTEVEIEDILESMADDLVKEDNKQIKPEIEFTQELLEEHQYVVLTFDNTLDWQVAREIFGIKSVHALDSKAGYERAGVGRIMDGKSILKKLQEIGMEGDVHNGY